jgi:hypothetical protein
VKALALNPWREVSAARIPAVHLEALAALRDKRDIYIHHQKEAAWVRWSDDRGDPVRYLLAVPGVEFFTIQSGVWYRFNSLLPAAETPPVDGGLPLATVLLPRPVEGFAVTVDGKIKSQYPALADAMKVGLDLKTKFPVIQVTIYDAAAKTRTPVELPEAK